MKKQNFWSIKYFFWKCKFWHFSWFKKSNLHKRTTKLLRISLITNLVGPELLVITDFNNNLWTYYYEIYDVISIIEIIKYNETVFKSTTIVLTTVKTKNYISYFSSSNFKIKLDCVLPINAKKRWKKLRMKNLMSKW